MHLLSRNPELQALQEMLLARRYDQERADRCRLTQRLHPARQELILRADTQQDLFDGCARILQTQPGWLIAFFNRQPHELAIELWAEKPSKP